jgi:hypothetical protein
MRDSVATTICSYGSSHESRVHFSHPCLVKTVNRSCTTEVCWSKSPLEEIFVRLELGLKARFLPWLQPGPPEEADRRDKTARGPHSFNVAHERLPWYTRAPGLRVVLVESPPSDTKAAGRGPH